MHWSILVEGALLMAQMPRALSPFRYPAYRWLAGSLALSLSSDGLWIVAVVWQVVALGGGPTDLSMATAAGAVGMLSMALFGGVLADRVPQRKILIAVELLRAGAAGSIAALAFSGHLAVWHLAAASFVGGVAAGLYYPAYSAILPSLLPPKELLPANGLEGMLRPTFVQAAGPALASALIAASSPAAAFAVVTAATLAAAGCVMALPNVPIQREPSGQHPVRAVFTDIREGVAYLVKTPWLLGTLLFASFFVLVMIGPFEVLTPFAIKDNAGGGPGDHALVLAAFGIGGAVGSMLISSFPLPRRYLTVMNLMWGVGCLPLALFGYTSQIWVMVAAGFLVGATMNAGMVIWGTLLQRRVPPELLGRVSSLDFFVSLSFMPLSMALAGPVSAQIGVDTTFLLAGIIPVVLAAIAIAAARMYVDEIEHPLDHAKSEPTPSQPVATAG
jgi:MFS family permease